MMKKFLAVLLAVMLVCGACAAALAELDLAPIREDDTLYSIDVDTESDVAYIESKLSAADRSFTHKYESSTRYSNTKFDILVVDYLKENAYPVMRLWVTYCADDDYMNITSASFILNGKKYTFSGIGNKDWYVKDDDGYAEQVLIRFGMDNIDFLVALEDIFGDTEDVTEAAENATCKLILHGREDVEVDLDAGFFLDFLVIKLGMVNINGLDFLEKASSSTMKVTDVE